MNNIVLTLDSVATKILPQGEKENTLRGKIVFANKKELRVIGESPNAIIVLPLKEGNLKGLKVGDTIDISDKGVIVNHVAAKPASTATKAISRGNQGSLGRRVEL